MNFDRFYNSMPDFAYRNFKYSFDDLCARGGARIAVRYRAEGAEAYDEWSYERLKKAVYAFARAMCSRGLAKGDAVGILSENRPEWIAAYYGAAISGLVAVPIDASLDDASVAYNVTTGKLKALCLSERFDERSAAFVGTGKPLLVGFDGKPNPRGGESLSWADALTSKSEIELPGYEDIKGDDIVAIIFTSGTTGIAKGIQLSHRNILANVNAALQALKPTAEDSFIGVLPYHHTYAATCTMLAPLTTCSSITIVERLVAKVLLGHVKDQKVTFFIAVPLLLDKLKAGMEAKFRELKGVKRVLVAAIRGLSSFSSSKLHINAGKVLAGSIRRQAGLNTVRLTVAGGGPLNYETARFFDSIGMIVVQGYGMSENSPLIAVNLPNYRDNRAVGIPVKDTEVMIDSPGPDGIGEIFARSPSVMKGYLDNPQATADTITPDGWLKTGDLGYINKKGFIFITGRSKNLIVTDGGKNIFPEELELKFAESKAIREVLVLGRKLGVGENAEEVIAVCVPNYEGLKERNGGKEFSKEEVSLLIRDEIRDINKTLPSYKKIVDFIVRDEEFEKTALNKVRRFLYAEYSKPVARK